MNNGVTEEHYFNGMLLSRSTAGTTSYVVDVLAKHTEGLKEAIACWVGRRKGKLVDYAQWHIDYLEGLLKQEQGVLLKLTPKP